MTQTRHPIAPTTAVPMAPPRSMPRPFILVSSDFARAGELAFAIQGLGVPCHLASDQGMLDYWRREADPAVFVLDLNVEWIRHSAHRLLRQGLSVVALSDDDEERLRAISTGYDETLPLYLPAREIAARLKARFVRHESPQVESPSEADGPLAIDSARRRVLWRGDEVVLTPMLFDLAVYFATRPRKFISAEELLREVWRERWADVNKVHKTVWRLREALGPEGVAFIVSKRGHGYGYFPD